MTLGTCMRWVDVRGDAWRDGVWNRRCGGGRAGLEARERIDRACPRRQRRPPTRFRVYPGTIALSRLHLPPGAAMAAERTGHRAGAALLVGARLRRYRGVGGFGHVQAVRRSRGHGAAVHHARRASGASGARQRGFGAAERRHRRLPRLPPPAPLAHARRRPRPPATAAPGTAARRNRGDRDAATCRSARHQMRQPPPHKPRPKKKKRRYARYGFFGYPHYRGAPVLSTGTRVSGGRSNRSAIATPASSGARITTGPSGAW